MRFKGQVFDRCDTHTSVDKSKYPIGSVWFDSRKKLFVRVVGYPLNDYYHDDYVGVCEFTANGEYMGYSASRTVGLQPTTTFPQDFRPKGEPHDC